MSYILFKVPAALSDLVRVRTGFLTYPERNPSGNVHCEVADYSFICLRAQLQFRLLKGWKMRFPKDTVWQTHSSAVSLGTGCLPEACPALIVENLNFYPSSILLHKNLNTPMNGLHFFQPLQDGRKILSLN